jgi:hypothetical protein
VVPAINIHQQVINISSTFRQVMTKQAFTAFSHQKSPSIATTDKTYILFIKNKLQRLKKWSFSSVPEP